MESKEEVRVLSEKRIATGFPGHVLSGWPFKLFVKSIYIVKSQRGSNYNQYRVTSIVA